MSDAYRCDMCGEFQHGKPEMELYTKESIDRQGTGHVKEMDVCQECTQELKAKDNHD
jgi:hypothetical protein